MSESVVKLTEETWNSVDVIYGIICERLEEMADTFIEIFNIDLGNYTYYKIDRVRLRIEFWDRGCMGDPNSRNSVYSDEDNCWCSVIQLTKNDVLNPEQWYTKMRKLKAEQDKSKMQKDKNAKLYEEELRREKYEELKKEFGGN